MGEDYKEIKAIVEDYIKTLHEIKIEDLARMNEDGEYFPRQNELIGRVNSFLDKRNIRDLKERSRLIYEALELFEEYVNKRIKEELFGRFE